VIEALLFGWSGTTWTIIIIVVIILMGGFVVTDDTNWFD
jgi:hypothetical protein